MTNLNLNPTKLILGAATPFVSAGVAWLIAAVGKYGLHLDPSGVNALAVAGLTAGTGVMVKLIHDVETIPAVERILHTVEGAVIPVAAAVEKVDPKAGSEVKDALAQAQAEVQRQFNELVATLPQPPVAPAPAPVAEPAPAPVVSAPAPVVPPAVA